jgi:hypothetical protein
MRIQFVPVLFALACVDGKAEEKCEAFHDVVCDALEEHCTFEEGDDFRAECMASAEAELDCTEVIDIGETYEECIDHYQSTDTCDLYEELPSFCEGILLF